MSRTDVAAHAQLLTTRLDHVHPLMLGPALILMLAMLSAVALVAVALLVAALAIATGAGAVLGMRRLLIAATTWRTTPGQVTA